MPLSSKQKSSWFLEFSNTLVSEMWILSASSFPVWPILLICLHKFFLFPCLKCYYILEFHTFLLIHSSEAMPSPLWNSTIISMLMAPKSLTLLPTFRFSHQFTCVCLNLSNNEYLKLHLCHFSSYTCESIPPLIFPISPSYPRQKI